MEQSELANIIHAGAFLVDSTQTTLPSDLRDLLVSRLVQYHASLGNGQQYTHSITLEEAQLETAKEALSVVEKVQQILHTNILPASGTSQSQDNNKTVKPSEAAPAIGIRDSAKLRTLLSITFKWGVEPLLALITSAWPSKPSPMLFSGPKIIDLTTTPEDYRQLSSFLVRILALLLPDGLHGRLPQTLITTTLLDRHLTDILKPCIALGWLPKSLSSEGTPTLDEIRPKIMRLFEILPPSQTISALGAVLSGTPLPVPHARKSCASLLSRQLLRPEGIIGLCAAVFGEEEDSETGISLEKLEHVAKVLSAVPMGMKPEEYLGMIVPRIIAILSNPSPLTHRRAAAFTLSRMLATDGSYKYKSIVVIITSSILHDPFLQIRNTTEHELSQPASAPSQLSYDLTSATALSTLMTFILHADPSPILISVLLSPIIPALYALSAYMDRLKTADPLLKESVKGLLATWGRVVESHECLDILWRVLEGEGGGWELDIAGEIKKVEKSENRSLSLLTPEDLRRAEQTGELDFDSNLLDLCPNPVHFVRFLKSVDRADVSSDVFVKLLEKYREAKANSEADPIRTMLYLQLIIQMQTQLSESTGSSSILSKPQHILSFVKHVLDSTTVVPPKVNRDSQRKIDDSLNLKDLRIVSDEGDFLDGGDSDDELSEGTSIPADEEMTATAINLLLAIFEVNSELSARTAPVLNDIFLLLEPLANGSSSVRGLAREARMVMTARLASVSSSKSSKPRSKNANEDKTRNTYQQALKLLQDPILPVRAHGLLLLRQLVSPSSTKSPDCSSVDPALIPSILSIFMQAIQDDDSYMFLNAVQGLVAMVETLGKDVLKGLVVIYSENLDGLAGTNLTQNDVDKRIRVGEALDQVIKRLGDALGIYVDIIVPPLTHVFRSHHIPTTLRTSALSLLSECVNSSSSAFSPYTVELSDAMVDLLQIETVPVTTKPRQSPEEGEEMEEDQLGATMDSQPTLTDSKLPPLRRAGLHLLALLLRASTAHVYSRSHRGNQFSRAQLSRAKTTLSYVASTDKDSIVRVMAREVIGNIDQLNEALAGL